MKADLTRNTFDPLKHFTRVLMQQGRVQLDSDWNEQAAILLRYLRTMGADVIGPAGGPDSLAFSVAPLPVASDFDFGIGLGHYYVAGILCEADAGAIPVVPSAGISNNEVTVAQWTLDGRAFEENQLVELFDEVAQPFATPAFGSVVTQIATASQANRKLTFAPPVDIRNGINPSIRRVLTYLTQPDLPQADPLTPTAGANGAYLAYLDVWERHITCIEDGAIREVALGGPDTATRSKNVWQVKVVKGKVKDPNNGRPCDGFTPDDDKFFPNLFGPNHGLLKARALRKAASTDPCIIAPDANYHGAENQLYRVEVHTPGAAAEVPPVVEVNRGRVAKAKAITGATFKWSRENGSVTFPIVGPISTGNGQTILTLASLGRDDRFGLSAGNWVELQDDDYVLRNRVGNLLQVQSIDRSRLQVTLSGTADADVGVDASKHPLLRRWDYEAGDPAEGGLTLGPDKAAFIQESDGDLWLSLENGVEIQFEPAPPGKAQQYRTGDYWLIPARTATADVEWPTETVTDMQGNTATTPLARPPLGIQHHYAPLGAIAVDSSGKVTVAADKQNSCRKQFKSVTSLS